MRFKLLPVILLYCGLSLGQGNGFSFTYTGPNQIIVGPDCIAELQWGHPNTPTVASNIPGGTIVSFNIYSISGGYQIGDDVPGGTSVTVFYQAIDNYGNSALFGFTIAFIDVLPPVFDPFTLPPNLTVNCIGNFPVAQVEISDNCQDQDILLTLTFTETNNAALCTGGTITRTWVADDDLGNMATYVQTITVLPDVTPPVIANNLVNGSSPCSTAMAQYSAWLNAQRAAFSATDSGCGLMSLTDNAPAPVIITSFCGEIVVTFSAKDNCNNISTVQRTFTIVNNVPPVINTPASDASGNCSQSNINQVFTTWINTHGGATATDDCSSPVWTTFPPSPSINDTCDAAIAVLFIAGDGCNNFDTTSASFFLTDDTPPTVTVDPTTMLLSCSATTIDSLLMDWLSTSGHSVAHDLCTADDDLEPGYRINGQELTLQGVLDAWQDSLASQCRDNVIINGVGINNVRAYIEVQFTYDDKCDNEAGETGFFGITDNGRPVFNTLPSDTSFACSQSQNWEDAFMQWYNTAGGATYSDACSDVMVQASITADSAIQYLTAALDTACMQGVVATIQFSLVDDCGNTSLNSPSASFGLQDTVPPVLTTPASDFAASCAQDGQTQLNNWLDTLGGAIATDGCGSLTWMFTWADTSGQPVSGVPNEGPYPSLPAFDCAGGLEIIFTASDICQNSVSDTAVFSLIDTLPPVITIVEDSIHLTCNDTITIDTPQVTDSCNGEISLTYEESASVDSCLGQPEIIIRTWTATDACGNSSTAQEVIFRIDSIPPTFELPSDTVEFCSVDTLLLLNLADNCDPSPVSSSMDIITGVVCNQVLNRIWTVTDACGNSTTAVQQFNLSDTSPPEIVYSPGHYTYFCNAGNVQEVYEQWMDSVTITDACSDVNYFIAVPGTYTLEDTTTWPGMPLPDSIILICGVDVLINGDLVVFDVCGNVIVEEISFSVMDTTGPVFTNCLSVLVVDPDTSTCEGLVHLELPAVEEICYPDDVEIVLLINNGDTIILDSTGILDTIMRVGIHTAMWIATDCKGNATTCLTSIEIIDENAISLSCPPDTILFATDTSCVDSLWVYPPGTTLGICAQGVVLLRMEIIGNASPDSVIFSSADDSVRVEFMAGIHEVLLIARDSTGDIDTCRYFVELRDTISPVLFCQNDTLLLHPSGVDSIDISTTNLVASVSDNCSVQIVQYDPATVDCDNAGQNINVTIILFDQSGNTDTCVSSLFVATQLLMPGWQRGLCDDTLRLFANIPPGPSANYTFSWSGPNGFMSVDENPVIPGSDTTYNGIYTLTVQSDNGCISTGSVEVLIQELVSPTILVTEDTICIGEQIELTTQSYSGTVSYQWYQVTHAGDTLVIVTTDPSLLFTPSLPGNYSFYAIVIQDTCMTAPSPDVNIVVIQVPIASISDIEMPLCLYDTLFLSPENIIDSLNYLWTGPGGFVSTDPIPIGIPAIEIDSPALFILTSSNFYCTSSADSLEVVIQPTPTTPVISGDTSACEEGSFTLTASIQADNYLWIDPLSNTTLTLEPTLNVFPAVVMHSGAWFVVSSINGCVSDTSGGFNVQVDTATAIQILAPDNVCDGDSIVLSIAPPVNGIYTWGGPGGFASQEVSPTVLAEEGTYIVFVETAQGCEATDSKFVAIDVLPSIISLETDAETCADGISPIQLWAITDPVSGGSFNFNWSGPGGFASQDSSPVIQNFNASFNGTYSLYIINGTCTSDTSSFEINVVDIPASPEISGQTMYCFGDTIVLNILSPLDGAVYTWTSSDTTVIVPSPGTLFLPDADQNFNGIYTVIVTIGDCSSLFSSVSILVSPSLPAPGITSPTLVCEGDSLDLLSDAPPGAVLQWSGPNGFQSNETNPVLFPATPANAGVYSALYILNGCMSETSSSAIVNVQSTIEAPSLTANATSVCIDNPEAVMFCIEQGTFTQGALYTWFVNGSLVEGPELDSCIVIEGNPLVGGANFITAVASLQGCPSDTGVAFIFTGDEFPAQQADAGLNMQYCPDEIIILDAADPTPSTGEWSSSSGLVSFTDVNDPNTSIGILPPGFYELTWTLSFASCIDFSADSVLIYIIPSPEVFPDTVDVPFGQTIEFIATTNDSISGIPFILDIISSTQKGNVLHAGNGRFRYTPNIGFVGTDMMTYRICSTDCPEECSEGIVILRVGDEDDCFTPTLFTPNEDGVNDILIVPCLETERFPSNEIIVFNEWGDAVFKASPYLNNWDGRSSGDPLPVGTYFYIMDFGDGSTPKRSFLVLER